jgi:hypothetical protein
VCVCVCVCVCVLSQTVALTFTFGLVLGFEPQAIGNRDGFSNASEQTALRAV